LRLIDDWRPEETAKYSGVSDRKSAAGYFVWFQLLGPSAIGKIVCNARESGNTQIVSTFDYRNNETPVECYRHAEIDVLLVNDLLAVYLCIEDGKLSQTFVHGLEDKRHERELGSSSLIKLIAMLIAETCDARHVDFVNRGDVCGSAPR